jgi:hypothetical protein
MGDFTVVGTMIGTAAPPLYYADAAEALEEGDMCNLDTSSELEKLDNASMDERDLVVVASAASSGASDVPYYWLMPGVTIVEGTMDTPGKVGDLIGVDYDSGTGKFIAAAANMPARFMIIKVVDSDTVQCVRWSTAVT